MRRNDWRARAHPSWWAFWLHRMSGLALTVFLPLHLLLLAQSLRGADGLGQALAWTDAPLFKLAQWGVAVLLALHLAGGLRVMWLEFGPWRGLRLVAWFVGLAFSLMFAALLAWVMVSGAA